MDHLWTRLLLLYLHVIFVIIAVDPRTKIVYYVETTGDHLVKAELSKDNLSGEWSMDQCVMFGDSRIVKGLLHKVPENQIQRVQPPNMRVVIDNCIITQNATSYDLANVNDLLPATQYGFSIVPGTKWCGPGHISNSEDDLGSEVAADACCREHDHCNDYMRGHTTKHGINNTNSFASLHCDCEEKLSNCLRRVSTTTSNNIGSLYFSVLQPPCYNFTYPIQQCLSYLECRLPSHPFHTQKCQEYQLDESKPMIWQFFDAKHYDNPLLEVCK